MNPRELLRHLFDGAVDAAAPSRALPVHLPGLPAGRTVVVGAGKAAAAMACATEAHYGVAQSAGLDGRFGGLVVTRYGHGVPCRRIEVVEAAHPVPDAVGRAAAARVLGAVEGLGADDLVLCLLSGGGSALLALPPAGVTLADKQHVGMQLLRSGASIAEINCVRKHLSAVKGGRLGVACYPARVLTLMISDVPGDDPAVIASGPTVADPSSVADALAVLARFRIEVPPGVERWLRAAEAETPKPGDPRLAACDHVVIATAAGSLAAAAEVARAAGVHPIVLGDRVEGAAREVAAAHAARARSLAMGADSARPCVLLSGGETTVTVRGSGRGGRNAEYALALALELGGQAGVWGIACDTDGIDGTEDNAGCVVAPDTLDRADSLGVEGRALLADNDAYTFFERLGDLVVTGPTRTNVNDFRAILVT